MPRSNAVRTPVRTKYKRSTSLVPNPNPKGEGSNRSLLFLEILKNRASESPKSELTGNHPAGTYDRKSFSK